MKPKIPYGYEIRNGLAYPHPINSLKLRDFFNYYVGGLPVLKSLRKAGVNCSEGGGRLMLMNETYLGTDYYPKLIEKKIFTKVKADDTEGYNNPRFYPDDKYVDCYFLDLSGKEGNNVCKIKRLQEGWICPVTYQILDTTFCGYSPLIVGTICEKLFAKYKCDGTKISLPSRPKDNDEVIEWEKSDNNIQDLNHYLF